MRSYFLFGTLLALLAVVSCGKNDGSGLAGVPRCLSQEEGRNLCYASYISEGFTLEQAKLRCDPFYLYSACYNETIPASP